MNPAPDGLPSDHVTPPAPSDPPSARSILDARFRSATIGLLAMITLIAFEALAVATAMPVAADDLGGVRQYGLAFSLFLTASLFGTVVAGGWADRAGPRVPTLVGMAVFGVGLVLAGTASSFTALLAGRAVSGLGAGLQSVVAYLVIAATYPRELQPRMFSAVSAAWVLPGLVGPSIAGLLATHVSWRAVFLVVPPLLVLLVPLLWPHLDRVESEGAQAGASAPDGGPSSSGTAVRLVRGAALAVGAALMQAGLVTLDTPLGRLLAVGGGAATVAALPGLLPAGLVRLRRGLPSLVVARMLYTATFFGAEAFLPLMLVRYRGLSPGQAGLTLTVGAVGWSVGAWLQGRPGLRPDRSHLPWIGGLLLGLAVPSVVIGVLPGVPPLLVVPVWIVAGLGMGLAASSTSVLLIRLSGLAEQGRNAAAVQIGDALGGVLGIGAAGAVFAALHDVNGDDAAVYTLIWLGLGVTGLLSAVVGARVRRGRPRGVEPGGLVGSVG